MQVKEHYHGVPLGANAQRVCGVAIAGFLPLTAGTITITDADGTVLVNAYPVVAGGPFLWLPLLARTSAGLTVSLAGGASGTLFT